MTVGELKTHLKTIADDVEVVIDDDEDGFYNLIDVQFKETEEIRMTVCNLISSNEA